MATQHAPDDAPPQRGERLRLLGETLLVALIVGAVALRHRLSAGDVAAPSSLAEAALAASFVGTPTAGFPGSFSETLLSWHVAAYGAISGAGTRYDSGLDVVRELVVVAAALGALALYVLCRRLGLGVLGSSVAVLLVGVTPAAASARLVAYPGTIATMWLLLGAVLLTVFAQRRHTAAAIVAAVAAAVAVEIGWATAPVGIVLAAGALIAVVLSGSVGAGWTAQRRAIALVASAAFSLAVLWLTVAGPFVEGAGAVSTATILAFTVVGLIAAALAGWLTVWLRPLAIMMTPLLLAALWSGPAQGSALVLALPGIGVLGVGLVDHVLTAPSRLRPQTAFAITAGLVAVVAATALVLPVSSPSPVSTQDSAATQETTSAPDPSAHDGAAEQRLAAWLQEHLGPDTLVLVAPAMADALLAEGVAEGRLQRSDTNPVPDPPAELMVSALADNEELPLVAAFGQGDDALGVRRIVDAPTTAQVAVAADRDARASFGSALAENPNLMLSGSAADALRSGEVDARLITVLAGAAGQYRFTVIDFPSTSGDLSPDPQRREALISDVSATAPGNDGGVDELQRYLQQQLPPYQPLSNELQSTILTVRYPAPSPVGLLS